MYEEGLSIRQIANQLGLSYSRVRRMLIKARVNFRGKVPYDKIQQIIEMGKQGYSANRISKELNINFNTVLRIFKKYNLGKKRRKLDRKEIEKIREEYNKGNSIYRIAKELNISTNLVVYHLKKMGLYRPIHESSPTSA